MPGWLMLVSVKPLDEELIQKTPGYLITAEENVLMGGFGSAVREFSPMAGS